MKTIVTATLGAMLIAAGGLTGPAAAKDVHCYAWGSPESSGVVPVRLIDQFGRRRVDVETKPGKVCFPASVTRLRSGRDARVTRSLPQVCYTYLPAGPYLYVGRAVRIRTQFGRHLDFVLYEHRLCVPSLGDPETQRFVCYTLDRDQTTFTPVRRRLTDRFGQRTVTVTEPILLCVPARLRHLAPRTHDERPLVCYNTDDLTFANRRFRVSTEFGTRRGDLRDNDELCVHGAFSFL